MRMNKREAQPTVSTLVNDPLMNRVRIRKIPVGPEKVDRVTVGDLQLVEIKPISCFTRTIIENSETDN